MASTGIVKAQERIAQLSSRLSGARKVADEQAQRVQRLAVAGGAAYLVGAWKKDRANNTALPADQRGLPTIAGMDPLLLYSVGSYLVGPMVGGRAGEILEDSGIGLLAAYAYSKAST